MKKIIFAITAFAAMFSIVSCEKEPETTVSNGTTILYASTESGLTKAALSGNDTEGYDVVWSEGDVIVFTNTDESKNYNFTLTSGAGTTSGVFECPETLAAGAFQARYGFSDLKLPDTQTYSAGKINNAPMAVSFTYEGGEFPHIQFKNICGLLRITVKGSASTKIKTIAISSDQSMAGQILSIDYPTIFMGGSKTVTLDCGEDGVVLSPEGTDFFISLPQPLTDDYGYSNVKIVLTDTNGIECIKTLKSGRTLSIERSQMTRVSITIDSPSEEFEVTPYSVEHFDWN